jgi:uncharacterized protein YjbJ (UPF0337 family)
MTPDNDSEVTGGVIGKIAGRLKETAGEALGRDDLAREGRLQQAGSDAERAEAQADQQRARETAAAARLEQDARDRELRADAIDPEEQR